MARFNANDRVTLWSNYSQYPLGFSNVKTVYPNHLKLDNDTTWLQNGKPTASRNESSTYIAPYKENDQEQYDRGIYILTLTTGLNRDQLEAKTTEQLKEAIDALELPLYERRLYFKP